MGLNYNDNCIQIIIIPSCKSMTYDTKVCGDMENTTVIGFSVISNLSSLKTNQYRQSECEVCQLRPPVTYHRTHTNWQATCAQSR